jgi:hypothetical protein
MKLFKLTAIATALIAGTVAQAATNVSTNIEMNNLWVTDLGLTQTGRVEVNLDSKQGKDNFVAAKASLIAKRDGSAAADDMWIQLGNASGSVKLGRFEGADLFPLSNNGKGASFGGGDLLMKAKGSTGYIANVLRGRDVDGAMADAFHGALNFNAGPVGVELGLVESKSKNGSSNVKGVRPVITGDLGSVKLAVGVEAVKSFDGMTNTSSSYTGFGVTGGFKLADGQFNLNYAGHSSKGNKNNSLGLNATFGPVVVGLVADKQKTSTTTGTTTTIAKLPTTTTVYGSYTLPLFNIAGASITPALSYSKATGNSVKAANVQLNYTF